MREFIKGWHEQFPDDQLIVLVPGHLPDNDDCLDGVRYEVTRLRLQALINAWALPRLAHKSGADLMVAHNFSPLFGNSSVFIHDVMFIDHPEWFTRVERIYFRLMVVTAQRANHLFTSSATEAERIKRVTAREKVTSVGLGLSEALIQSVARPPSNLPLYAHEFYLSVGRLNVRKNLVSTIEALAAANLLSPEMPLVIVGEASGRTPREAALVQRLVEENSVIFMGAVPEGELRWLYENCAVFVFMSLDEGFGLPCIEALHFQAPAAVSDISVFHELLGDYAEYAAPLDFAEISRAVIRAQRQRDDLADTDFLGRNYDWSSCVQAIRQVSATN